MTLVINHSNQLSLSYSQKPTVLGPLLPFNKLSKPNVNNTIYVSLIFKDNPFPRYIKHVATYICGLLVLHVVVPHLLSVRDQVKRFIRRRI